MIKDWRQYSGKYKTIKCIREEKAVGYDNIPLETLKTAVKRLTNLIEQNTQQRQFNNEAAYVI